MTDLMNIPQVGVTTVELVSPDSAKEMLKLNKYNRALCEKWVTELARRIVRKDWSVTHQGLAFDEDGNCIDGQHRLHAVIKAGVPVLIRVTRGLSRDCQWDIDIGRVRSNGAVIDLIQSRDDSGKKNGKQRQAIAAVLSDFVNEIRSATAPESLESLKPLSDGVEYALSKTRRKSLSLAAVEAAVSLAYRTNPKMVEEFYDGYLTGVGLSEGSPALTLRNHAFTTSSADRMARRNTFLCACACILAHVSGEQRKLARASPSAVRRFAAAHGMTTKGGCEEESAE